MVPHRRASVRLYRQHRGWRETRAAGAALVWRAEANGRFPVEERFADRSYRSTLRWNPYCRSLDRTPVPVRVIEYTLPGVPDAEARNRLVTTLLGPAQAPAAELAALYHERWEIAKRQEVHGAFTACGTDRPRGRPRPGQHHERCRNRRRAV